MPDYVSPLPSAGAAPGRGPSKVAWIEPGRPYSYGSAVTMGWRTKFSCGGGDVVCRASGFPRPVPGVPPERNLKGTSFAVANVTGVLARELVGGSRPTVASAIAALQRAHAGVGSARSPKRDA